MAKFNISFSNGPVHIFRLFRLKLDDRARNSQCLSGSWDELNADGVKQNHLTLLSTSILKFTGLSVYDFFYYNNVFVRMRIRCLIPKYRYKKEEIFFFLIFCIPSQNALRSS